MEEYKHATQQGWQVPTEKGDKEDLPDGVPLPSSATETNPPASGRESQPSMGQGDGNVDSCPEAQGPAASLHEHLRMLGLRGQRAVAARRPSGTVELKRERAERELAEDETPDMGLNGKPEDEAGG